MAKRFVSIWFRHLNTDWFISRKPLLKNIPFVLRTSSHGRMIISAVNTVAMSMGLRNGMVLADALAGIPELKVLDDKPDLSITLLKRIAEWCIRFAPLVSIDPPDSLLIDATGCAHLWGGEFAYLSDIVKRLNARGYNVKAAMADTVGLAWGIARFGKEMIIASYAHVETLKTLPPEALRLETETIERLHKLGLHKIGHLIKMPRSSLRRRFGQHFIMRLDMAIGQQIEMLEPFQPPVAWQERLPCLDPICTAGGIEIALRELLESLCYRLQQEQKGLRSAVFTGYRVDGKVEKIEIGTNRPTHHVSHLFKLFELKISTIEPALGIELFILEAPTVEDHFSQQEKIWEGTGGLEDVRLSELIDHLAGKIGAKAIKRYVPDEHYWPERSFKAATNLHDDEPRWNSEKQRPIQLLSKPEAIEVTAPIPDYPPMLFRHNGKLHKIIKADGPERIEQEWWLQQGQHRDYYRVEDEEGHRYWIFRLGHYHDKLYQWFIHGFFA